MHRLAPVLQYICPEGILGKSFDRGRKKHQPARVSNRPILTSPFPSNFVPHRLPSFSTALTRVPAAAGVHLPSMADQEAAELGPSSSPSSLHPSSSSSREALEEHSPSPDAAAPLDPVALRDRPALTLDFSRLIFFSTELPADAPRRSCGPTSPPAARAARTRLAASAISVPPSRLQ